MHNPLRHAAGRPTGGQFAPKARTDSDAELSVCQDVEASTSTIETFLLDHDGYFIPDLPDGRLIRPTIGNYDQRHGRVLIQGSRDGMLKVTISGRRYDPEKQLLGFRDRSMRRWIEAASTMAPHLRTIARSHDAAAA